MNIFNKKNHTKKSYFTIEFYPETKRYYPKYKNKFLKKDYFTGIMGLEETLTYASHGETKDRAMYYIELFKEQRLKENVRIIEVEP